MTATRTRDHAAALGSAPVGRLLWTMGLQTTASVGLYGIYALTNAWFVARGVGRRRWRRQPRLAAPAHHRGGLHHCRRQWRLPRLTRTGRGPTRGGRTRRRQRHGTVLGRRPDLHGGRSRPPRPAAHPARRRRVDAGARPGVRRDHPGGLHPVDRSERAGAVEALRIVALGFAVAGVAPLVSGYFQALGRAFGSYVISIGSLVAVKVPLVLALSGAGPGGVWVALAVGEFVACLGQWRCCWQRVSRAPDAGTDSGTGRRGPAANAAA